MPASRSRLSRTSGGRGGPRSEAAASAVAAPQTRAEALDAAIETEERAERFAVGPKAQRLYEEAFALYTRAASLDASSAVAHYNAARVLYVLATSFYLPPRSLEQLQAALTLYARALALAPPLPDAFALDVRYNGAVASQSLAELVEEAARVPDEAQVLALLGDAVRGFEDVAAAQVERLRESAEMLRRSREEEAQDASAPAPAPATVEDDSMEEDEGNEQEAWTESPVTPASTLETFLALHACGLSMLSRATAVGSAQTPSLEAALLVVNGALSRADELVATCENAAELSDEGEWLVALGDLAQAKRASAAGEASRRAELAVSAAQSWPSEAEEPALRALETQVLEAITQLLSATATDERPETRIQRLCDISDTALQLAVIRTQHASSGRAWELASAATKGYLEAVAALQRSGSLGASDASTPTGRARCSLRASLCAASLLRSAGAAPASLTDAQRTTLRENARVYARQALVDAGLKGATLADARRARDAAAAHSPLGGWEGMRCTADALLAAARALWSRTLLPQAAPHPPEEMLALLASAWALLHGPHAEAWTAAFALDEAGPRRVTDEGWAISADEGAFWARWTAAATSATWEEALAAAM